MHGFTDKVTGDDGSRGHDVGLCTLITRSELLCHSQVILSTGQLAFQGILHQHDHNTPGTVLGGTGAYNGARGTAHITDVNPTTTKVAINLVGSRQIPRGGPIPAAAARPRSSRASVWNEWISVVRRDHLVELEARPLLVQPQGCDMVAPCPH